MEGSLNKYSIHFIRSVCAARRWSDKTLVDYMIFHFLSQFTCCVPLAPILCLPHKYLIHLPAFAFIFFIACRTLCVRTCRQTRHLYQEQKNRNKFDKLDCMFYGSFFRFFCYFDGDIIRSSLLWRKNIVNKSEGKVKFELRSKRKFANCIWLPRTERQTKISQRTQSQPTLQTRLALSKRVTFVHFHFVVGHYEFIRSHTHSTLIDMLVRVKNFHFGKCVALCLAPSHLLRQYFSVRLFVRTFIFGALYLLFIAIVCSQEELQPCLCFHFARAKFLC